MALHRRFRLLMVIVIAALLVYLLLCVGLLVFQRALIYHPQANEGDTPASLMAFTVDGVRLKASVRPHDGPQALLYLGGNAEDVSLNLPDLALAFPDQALYLLHYRGFGGSDGSATESALQADALALYDLIAARHPRVTVIGRSLGSGVAIYLASQRPVARLVLVTPFNSLAELASQRFALFPVRWLLKDRFDSWRYAPQVTAPTRLVAAAQDTLVPRASSERLLAHFAKGVATLQFIPASDHNSISDSPAYWQALKAD